MASLYRLSLTFGCSISDGIDDGAGAVVKFAGYLGANKKTRNEPENWTESLHEEEVRDRLREGLAAYIRAERVAG